MTERAKGEPIPNGKARPKLPLGWTRKYHDHWSCSDAWIYSDEFGSDVFEVCYAGISAIRDSAAFSLQHATGAEWRALSDAMTADHEALRDAARSRRLCVCDACDKRMAAYCPTHRRKKKS